MKGSVPDNVKLRHYALQQFMHILSAVVLIGIYAEYHRNFHNADHHYSKCQYSECHYCECECVQKYSCSLLSVIMLNVVMFNVVELIVKSYNEVS